MPVWPHGGAGMEGGNRDGEGKEVEEEWRTKRGKGGQKKECREEKSYTNLHPHTPLHHRGVTHITHILSNLDSLQHAMLIHT